MNKIITWFKSLPVPFQILTLTIGWTITFLWLIFIAGHIEWCPGIEYSYQCDIGWINFASGITLVILWAGGLLGTGMYYDHKERK